eukprot:scaffold1487_cov116-Isochrysis_galbana.AAC.1
MPSALGCPAPFGRSGDAVGLSRCEWRLMLMRECECAPQTGGRWTGAAAPIVITKERERQGG